MTAAEKINAMSSNDDLLPAALIPFLVLLALEAESDNDAAEVELGSSADSVGVEVALSGKGLETGEDVMI